jgi:8-oxo-dGTP pyrophosphatase MutT (NUDIX family)
MSLRPAAVLVPLYRAPRNSLLFVRRAAHLRRQPNHVAFPGGVADDADGDDRTVTALREFEEELGIGREHVTLVGTLPERAAIAAAFSLTPIVGVLSAEVEVQPDPGEIGEVFEVPLERIFSPGAIYEGDTDLGDRIVTSWQFDYGPMHVWGATGRILESLVTDIRANTNELRDRLRQAGVELPQPLQALHGG